MNNLISKASVCEILADIYPTDGEKVVAVKEVDKAYEAIQQLPSAQPEIIHCKDCKNSEHWYRDRRRCFLWSEDGISVFDDGFCNYAERRHDG